LGAAVGAVTAPARRKTVADGALIGGADTAQRTLIWGASKGQTRADHQASQQLRSVALHRSQVARNFTISGYVFFPAGQYRQVEMIVINGETGDTETIREPLL
jgi:hypothetical protein